jgi:hypothetical protein
VIKPVVEYSYPVVDANAQTNKEGLRRLGYNEAEKDALGGRRLLAQIKAGAKTPYS